jgi:predicted component of type VI protein secretion system
MNRALLGAALFALFAALLVLAGCSTSEAPVPTTTTAPADCVAVTINVTTGEQTETPTPCLTSTGRCTGQITYRVEDDGSVIVTC